MFYDLYSDLCKERGVSLNKAASEMGLSNSTVTKWKKTKATPSGDTLSKVAEYFNVSMDFLLSHSTEKAPATQGERQISDQEIKVAMMGGGDEVTDAMWQEVKNFAAFVVQREKEKKG